MNQREMEKTQNATGVTRRFSWTAAPTPRRSQLIHQVPNTNVHSFSNSHQGKNTRSFFTAFQLSHINRMQFGSFREFFLAQFGKFSVTANGFADDFLMSQGFRHAFSGKQEAGEINTVHSPLFFAFCSPGRGELVKLMTAEKEITDCY